MYHAVGDYTIANPVKQDSASSYMIFASPDIGKKKTMRQLNNIC
jgi:hypothetical protein